MKNILWLLLLLVPALLSAQDSLVFKTSYKADKVYTTTIKTVSDIEINMQSTDSAEMEKIAASGLQFPMTVNAESATTSVSRTGRPDSTGSIPYVVEYVTAHTIMKGMGMDIDKDGPLANTKIFGHFSSDGKSSIDSISNMPAGSPSREALVTAVRKIQQNIHFPEKALKVGDTFTQEVPIEVPVAGMKPLAINITASYTLKSIADNMANFDIAMTIKMEVENEKFHISATGDGNGTSVFDIQNSILKDYTSKMNMTMNFDMQDAKMTMKVAAVTNQAISVDQ